MLQGKHRLVCLLLRLSLSPYLSQGFLSPPCWADGEKKHTCIDIYYHRGAGTGPAGPAGAGPMLVRETNFIEMKDRHFKQVSYLRGKGGGTNQILTRYM